MRSDAGGLRDDGTVWPVLGLADPLAGLRLELNGADSAGNQAAEPAFIGTGTHLVTSSILEPDTYPQFESFEAADWEIPGEKPFDPRTGAWMPYSQNSNQGYKRLMRTIDRPADELRFWTSYNTEANWDFVFVEVHTVGQDNWTTLPDQNVHTRQTPVGESCEAGWQNELHHQLRYYMNDPVPDTGGNCVADRVAGHAGRRWHAATGNSGGWQEWVIDLSAYAGQQVEVSITAATDWGTLTDARRAGRRHHGHPRRRDRVDGVRDGPRRLDGARRAGGRPVDQHQRLDPLAEALRGCRDHRHRRQPLLRIRSRGRQRRGQPQHADGPLDGVPAPRRRLSR